jgi:hypothetical protein
MAGIAIGRCDESNALLIYNPRNKRYYRPDTYRLDPYRLPCSVYPDMKYDGGLFCSLKRDDSVQMEEKYPPGTRVEQVDLTTNILKSGTVMNIPLSLPADGCSDALYSILFDDGSTSSVPLSKMADIIPKPPVELATNADASSALLPPFLLLKSKTPTNTKANTAMAISVVTRMGYTNSNSRPTSIKRTRTGL